MSELVKIEKNREISGLVFKGGEHKFALVLLHAFNQSPEHIKTLATFLADSGILVLAPKYTDVADGISQAINSIRYAITHLGFKSEQLGVAGLSLGGTVSLLVSTQEQVSFVGNYGGWVDMANLYEFLSKFPRGTPQRTIADTIKSAVGTPSDNPEVYSLSSPITYVDLINGSILLIHGEKDDMVPLSQSQILYEKLKQLGKDVELYILNDSGYLFTGYEKNIAEITLRFLKSRGKI